MNPVTSGCTVPRTPKGTPVEFHYYMPYLTKVTLVKLSLSILRDSSDICIARLGKPDSAGHTGSINLKVR